MLLTLLPKTWNLCSLTVWRVEPVRRNWAKNVVAFGASTTVVALLLICILPEIVWSPKEKAESAKPKIQAKMDITNASIKHAPDRATTLLLPRPPSQEKPNRPPPKTNQSANTTQPENTATDSLPQKQSEVAEISPSDEIPETSLEQVQDPRSDVVPSQKLLVEPPSPPKPSTTIDVLAERVQIDAASAIGSKTGHRLSSRLNHAVRVKKHFAASDFSGEAEGRALLRILEYGSGPEVEIAWPVSMVQRQSLYRLLEACYGMEIALMDSSGRLYRRIGEVGQPWQPNLDRYSGIVRQPSGSLTDDEQINIDRIYKYHGVLHSAENVRLFPRRLDALLLGGLKTLIGDNYAVASIIRARYRRDGHIVLVEGISIDGRSIFGHIDLSKANRHCQSSAWS